MSCLFRCQEYVYWTEGSGDDETVYTKTIDRFEDLGIPDYHKDGLYCLMEGHHKDEKGGKVTVTEGHHEWPFSFKIPEGFDLPSSYMWDGIGHVAYLVEGYLDIPMWRDFNAKFSVRVVVPSCPSHVFNNAMVEPYRGTTNFGLKSCCCCGDKGTLEQTLSTNIGLVFHGNPSTGVPEPSSLELRVKSMNNGTAKITKIKAALVHHVDYYLKVDRSGHKTHVNRPLWNEDVECKLDPMGERTDTFTIKFPVHMNLKQHFTMNEKIIESQFQIKVWGELEDQCCPCEQAMEAAPLFMIPPDIDPSNMVVGQVGEILSIEHHDEEEKKVEDDFSIGVSPFSSSSGMSKVQPEPYSITTTNTQLGGGGGTPFDQLFSDVQSAGLGMSQKDAVESAVQSGTISTISCEQVSSLMKLIDWFDYILWFLVGPNPESHFH